MPKISKTYLEIDPFKIIESGFHPNRSRESESIFSLGNEYSGIRGYFDEGYSGDTLQGSYFNGIYAYALSDTPNAYKGIVKRTHFTINSVNYVKCSIKVGSEALDLNQVKFTNFTRILDMQTGEYVRTFTWNLKDGTNIKLEFKRLVNMVNCHEAVQSITFTADKDTTVDLSLSLDSNVLHWSSDCYWNRNDEYKTGDAYGLSVTTVNTNQSLVSLMKTSVKPDTYEFKDKEVTLKYHLTLLKDISKNVTRYVINLVDKESTAQIEKLKEQARNELNVLVNKGYEGVLRENTLFYQDVWNKCDIEIGGDVKNQQGIRYCIFQLVQTYHGYEKDNNIGAKGLTGEAYSGHAFWDSETYCLPFYLFSNQEASKNLLMFRYHTLAEAKARAKDLDCEGACYPIATRNGKEGCNLWQHASLQFQPSTAVFYAVNHYMNLYHDDEFMINYGLEMITEIAKFLLSRGDYNQDHTKFSFYNVMGPDEFQMMVNHNCYTNFMAKKTFDYLINIINHNLYNYKHVFDKCGFDEAHINKMIDASKKMVILYDEKTHLFEQNAGFFDLPHLDINKIPEKDFPLYSHWSYDHIYRNDMIKQPDVLMFMFLYNQDFSLEEKKANYEYYEPRCIHESSLSPSIHSIFASELGKSEEAYKFFGFATRLDLDDYNCNTKEGIHTTSIAAAWMNIVYGFGGLRSDKEKLILKPAIIDDWTYYSFKLTYQNKLIKVYVSKDEVKITLDGDITLNIDGKDYNIHNNLRIKR